MTTRSISKAIRHKVQLPTILLVDTYMSTGKLSVSQVPVKVLGEQQAGAAPHMALCKTGWHFACQTMHQHNAEHSEVKCCAIQ